MSEYLLIVTEDGYGKRVAVAEIPRRMHRDGLGVRMSTAPIAFAQVVDNADADLMLATSKGRFQRLRVGDVPIRRRRAGSTKGVRVMRLDSGDRVAAGAVTDVAQTHSAVDLRLGWGNPRGR